MRRRGVKQRVDKLYQLQNKCFCDIAHPFSFPPDGGSTRAALGRKGDLGERDCCEGEEAGAGPSV